MLLLLAAPATAEPIPSPPLVENGGMLGAGDRAFVIYLDAELLIPPLMVGYRHGVLPWLELGLDVGGSTGLVQGLAHARARLYESPRSRRIFIGARLRTGPKIHELRLSDGLIFDDRGWIFAAELALAVRLGARRRTALYLGATFYAEVDLRTPARQTDLFLVPASLGIERLVGRGVSVFAEIGPVWMINGTETADEVLYQGSWFPVGQFGFAVRLE